MAQKLVVQQGRTNRFSLRAKASSSSSHNEKGREDRVDEEREINLEAIFLQGEKERCPDSNVFSFDLIEDEDWETEEDWVDSKFRTSIKPITEEDKGRLKEMGKKIEAAATPQPGDGSDPEEESAYSAHSGFQEIETEELNELLVQEAVTVLDIRSREEYKKVHIGEAINIPFDEFSVWNQTGQLEKYKKETNSDTSNKKDLAIICHSGKTSAQATVRLTKVYGFDATVYNVKGGMNQWILRGFPTQQGQNLRWHY
jgi:rhodanese-related sulfurtransferase